MNTPAKLATFVAALGVVFGAAAGAGALVGPVAATAPEHEGPAMSEGHGGETAGAPAHGAAEPPKGLQISQDGYTLDPQSTTLPATGGTYAFRIVGPAGRAVTEFTPTHDKKLHLIVVRRDLAGFAHVHPVMSPDGTWRVPLRPSAGAGTYRVFADFAPGDHDPLTLGTDLSVAGSYTPRQLPAPSRTATVDGYTVTLDGALRPGTSSKLTLTVSRDGRPVTDLQPYLAAYGHLVAIRAGDLGYLHVHPDGAPGDGKTRPGPAITFYVEVPTAGDYRLFLDFQHAGVVRTAEFTAAASGSDDSDASDPSHDADTGDGAHTDDSGSHGHDEEE